MKEEKLIVFTTKQAAIYHSAKPKDKTKDASVLSARVAELSAHNASQKHLSVLGSAEDI